MTLQEEQHEEAKEMSAHKNYRLSPISAADTFTYEHMATMWNGPYLSYVNGLSAQDPGQYTLTIEDYGNLYYFTRFMAHMYPIEEAGKGGRLERFHAEVLGQIPVHGGFANTWNQVWLSFGGHAKLRAVGP